MHLTKSCERGKFVVLSKPDSNMVVSTCELILRNDRFRVLSCLFMQPKIFVLAYTTFDELKDALITKDVKGNRL